MRIWRVEKEGTGPYYKRYLHPTLENMADQHNSEEFKITHPTAYRIISDLRRDLTLFSFDSFFCGFTCVEQMITWFDGWWKDLASYDFMINVYEVDPQFHATDDRQAVFVKFKAALVESVPIKEFLR